MIQPATIDQPPEPFGPSDQARAYLDAARAPNTRRAYRSDWQLFSTWCAEHARVPLPAEPGTVIGYLIFLAPTLKASTIERRLASIGVAHTVVGLASPTTDAGVRGVWSGIRRTNGTAQSRKAALLADDIRALVSALPKTPGGTRDRAVILLGFAGALRRSELVALDVCDVEIAPQGAIVTIRRSKTDQEGEGVLLGIPRGTHPATCPVQDLVAWLDLLPDRTGPIFRKVDRHGRISRTRLCDRSVAEIVKRTVICAGLDPTRYSGHSLRAGLATSAALAGVPEREIMAQTRHKSVVVARRYIRAGSVFRNNAAGQLGL